MKEIIQQRLTSNSEINKHILANANLNTVVGPHLLLVDMIRRLFLSDELTREEVHTILYDVYHVDKNFSMLSVETIEFLAELGYEHEQIIENSMNYNALSSIVSHYKYLDILSNHQNRLVSDFANVRLREITTIKKKHPLLFKLISEIDLAKFRLIHLESNRVKVTTQNINYKLNNLSYDVRIEVVDCNDSFTICLLYDKLPLESCAHAEKFFNKYAFKELPDLHGYSGMKHGNITGLSLKEVLQFIKRESHTKY